jgi:hypothetical protein
MGDEIDKTAFTKMALYPQLEGKVWWVYLAVFTICLLMFAAVIYFVSQLLNFAGPAVAPIVN